MMRIEDPSKLQPTDDNVVIKRLGAWPGLSRESSLIVVEEKPPMEAGIVLAVGPGWSYFGFDQSPERAPMSVKVGDIVMMSRYAGAELDPDHVIAHERELFGVYDGPLQTADEQS